MINLILLILIILIVCNIVKKKEGMSDTSTYNILMSGKNKNIFTRKYPECSPRPKEDKGICKLDMTKPCRLENRECFVEADDVEQALRYGLHKLCIDKGHCFAEYDDGTYECLFTKESCLNASENKVNMDPEALIKDEEGDILDHYPYFEWRDGVGCINGLGFDIIKEKICKKDTPCSMGMWEYDSSIGSCKITKRYCEEMKMVYRNGTCQPKDATLETLLGVGMVRGQTNCPKHFRLWNDRSLTNSKSTGTHHGRLTQEKCFSLE